ncbi:unnamed protein product [Pocillopora meandrina]|uniref:Kazal-like domain-containing protein n=1 Tax=Pocillopora meandrina TaxID=46732 RepID=A0AAU9W523_9CNID|nr:unnamed protein product [Pocillopora meandrina]
MKLHVYLSSSLVTLSLYAWVDCANVPSCAHMRSWFPRTPPSDISENVPYLLTIDGHAEDGYLPGSSHTIYLNGSKTFFGFIVYAENSVKNYTNGHFVKEDLPLGVEEVSCGDLYIVQNSTSSGNWTSVKMLWKAPHMGHVAGNITFRASVLENRNPLVYYEGFTAHLKYQCPLRECEQCVTDRYKTDSYGCHTCQCKKIAKCKKIKHLNYVFDCNVYNHSVFSKIIFVIVISAVNAPVCGTDGITYDNKCKMNRQSCVKESSITVQYEGKCGSAARDECNKHCSKDYRPVCGTNGKSYNNECHIRGSACTDGINVTVAYRGECNELAPGVQLLQQSEIVNKVMVAAAERK